MPAPYRLQSKRVLEIAESFSTCGSRPKSVKIFFLSLFSKLRICCQIYTCFLSDWLVPLGQRLRVCYVVVTLNINL